MLRSFLHSQAQRWTIGVCAGTTHVKLICLSLHNNQPQLMAHAIFKRTNLKDIKAALRHPAIRSGDVRIGFAEPTMKIHKVYLPQLPEKELDKVVKWAVKDLDAPPEDYVFRYVRTPGEATDEGLPYVVFAIERKMLAQRAQELKDLGLTAKANIIEPNANALANAVVFNHPPEKDERYAVIDFGNENTLFAVVSASGLLFARFLSGIAGKDLTFLISRDRSISEQEAEIYKISEPDLLRGPNVGDTQGVIQHLSKSALEIQLALDKYSLQYPDEYIARLYITGGASRLKMLKPYIQDTLKLQTEYLDPFLKVDTSRFDNSDFREKSEFYGVAMGLAL